MMFKPLVLALALTACASAAVGRADVAPTARLADDRPAVVGSVPEAYRGPQPGDAAPPLEGLEWLRGAAPAPGEPYALFFWGTWCVPCKPMIAPLMERANDLGIPVVAVSRDERERLEGFLATWAGPALPHVAIEPHPHPVHTAYHAWTVPRLVYIGADGRVTRVVYGPQPIDAL